MIKQFILCLFLTCFSVVSLAKPAETTCPVASNFDIIIDTQSVRLIEQNSELKIFPNGKMALNQRNVTSDRVIQQKAAAFQTYLRKELPAFLLLSDQQLANIYQVFISAIDKRLGNDSRLIQYIDRLNTRLKAILDAAIYHQDEQLIFNHQKFNAIKHDGEDIAKRIFTTATLDSLIHFNIFKNYSAIKTIAGEEWKAQKPALKIFNQQVCDLMADINTQYNLLRAEID
ncbi:DUF2884 family protein [Utexia brackfieldae]|uniref:DUF2884 family protein n=1 Tax=Utexia brackfieldae TaxID=3074108 RepID=UPI00370D8724